MADLSLQADCACATPVPDTSFDPASWLEQLKSCGGLFSICHNGQVALGYMVHRNPDGHQRKAREMLNSLTDEQVDAIKAHLEASLRWEG